MAGLSLLKHCNSSLCLSQMMSKRREFSLKYFSLLLIHILAARILSMTDTL